MTAAVWLALILSVGVALSSIALPFPDTPEGMDAHLWTQGMGVLLMILSAARVRAPRDSWRAAILLVAASGWLLALPFVNGYGSTGQLAVAWWDLVLFGGALTVVSLAGLALALRSRQPGNG